MTGALSPGVACPLPSAVPASVSARWSLVGCQWLVFVLRSWPLAATLPAADVDHPESRCLRIETGGLFAVWEGMPSLRPSLPLSPPPCLLCPAGMAGLPQASSSLEFLSPFVLRTAGSEFGPVNFSSLSHSLKKLPPTALRAFGPVLTLSNAARSSPFRLHLLVAGAGVWGYFSAGSCF